MSEKKTRGRQKIGMELIENLEHRMVTFSKRRGGIYKKASEICRSCDAEIAIFMTSPTGKPFSFVHPNFEAITRKLFHQPPNPNDADEINTFIRLNNIVKIDNMFKELDKMHDSSEGVRERKCELDRAEEGMNKLGWWRKPVEEHGVEEAMEVLKLMDDVQSKLFCRTN